MPIFACTAVLKMNSVIIWQSLNLMAKRLSLIQQIMADIGDNYVRICSEKVEVLAIEEDFGECVC